MFFLFEITLLCILSPLICGPFLEKEILIIFRINKRVAARINTMSKKLI